MQGNSNGEGAGRGWGQEREALSDTEGALYVHLFMGMTRGGEIHYMGGRKL